MVHRSIATARRCRVAATLVVTGVAAVDCRIRRPSRPPRRHTSSSRRGERRLDAAAGRGTKKSPLTVDAKVLAAGKSVFKNKCQKCHGPSGLGDGPDADPDHQEDMDLTKSSRAAEEPGRRDVLQGRRTAGRSRRCRRSRIDSTRSRSGRSSPTRKTLRK